MSRIKNVKVEVLGNSFDFNSNKLKEVSFTLGAQDRASSCNITIIDIDLEISDKFYKWSKENGGIKIPAELRGSSGVITTPDENVTPENPADPLPGTPNGSGGKLEGIEDEPLSFSAFLETIGWCENKGYGMGNLAYNVRFGGETFSDYSKHPCIDYCSGGLCSNAAGAFQFIGCDPDQSWEDLRALYPKELPGSFAPKYQNIAAKLAIKHYSGRSNDAYNKIRSGTDSDIKAAAKGLSWFWASLPGAPYGQPTVTDAQFLAKYKEILARRQSEATTQPATYNNLYDVLDLEPINTAGWGHCRLVKDSSRVTTIELTNHGNDQTALKLAKYLITQNSLRGSFCTDHDRILWISEDFIDINEKYQCDAIFHQAGLLVSHAILKPVNGFNNALAYIKPLPKQSPYSPQYEGEETEGTVTAPTEPEAIVGEKIYIIVTTDEGEIRKEFILTDTEVSNFPVTELRLQGSSIRYSLDTEIKAENYLSMTPGEIITVISSMYGIRVNDYSSSIAPRKNIDQRYRSDLDLILQLCKTYDLTLTENEDGSELEVSEGTTPANLILADLINISFSDNAVVDEKPTYPVRIKALTSQSLLELIPESSVNLDNVYNQIPESIKNGTWVINTITHDLHVEETTIELLKYIPVVVIPTVPGGGGGSADAPSLNEQQLLEKYKSATVKVGSASGAFITSDGYILTAAHMDDPTIKVETLDGKKFTAQKLGKDDGNDFMLLKVDGSGYNFFNIAPDSKIWEQDKSLNNPIYKLGHGWSSEDGRGEGSKDPKYWDITASNVVALNSARAGVNSGARGTYIIVNDKTIDFANPGDSGCPWFDKWGLIVSCTSGGTRTHAEGAGKKNEAWGGETAPLHAFLKKYPQCKYTTGVRTTAAPPTTSPDPGNPGGGSGSNSIGQKILGSLQALGKFSTTESGLGRNPCGWCVAKVMKHAGLQPIGANPNYVPSVREALQAGRGTLISSGWDYKNAQVGDVFLYRGCYHIGLFLTPSLVRSSSSSREMFDNDDPDGTLFGTYGPSSGDGSYNTSPEIWRLKS